MRRSANLFRRSVRGGPPGAGAIARVGLAIVLVARASVAAADEPITVRGLTFVARESAERHVVVRAGHAAIDPGSEVARLEDVVVEVTGDDVGGVLVLRCRTARVALGGEAFRLEGDVRGEDAEGRLFETAWLEYDEAAAMLRTDAPVTVLDGTARYSGASLRYELDTRRLRLGGGTRVVRGAP